MMSLPDIHPFFCDHIPVSLAGIDTPEVMVHPMTVGPGPKTGVGLPQVMPPKHVVAHDDAKGQSTTTPSVRRPLSR